jgi:hypothetical protein
VIGTLAVGLTLLIFRPLAFGLNVNYEEFKYYMFGATLLPLAAMLGWVIQPLRKFWFPALVVAHLVIGTWVIRKTTPEIDVIVFQRDSAAALLNGRNPYAITFADPYTKRNYGYYGDGLAKDGRLLFGFPYLPVSLLWVLPGYLVGDIRFAHLLAVVLSAIIMHRMADDDTGKLAAAAFLFTPLVFHFESMGWTEAIGVLLTVSSVYVWMRKPAASWWLLGLLFAWKQYSALLAPVAWRAMGARTTLLAALLACVVASPFLIWDSTSFLHAVAELQFRQPWRNDALSFSILLHDLGFPKLPWLGFLTAGVAVVFVRSRPTKGEFEYLRNCALILLLFFAFSKQAFYNYYFLVIGVLSCALAAPEGAGGEAADKS